jgi:hypothetical protein
MASEKAIEGERSSGQRRLIKRFSSESVCILLGVLTSVFGKSSVVTQAMLQCGARLIHRNLALGLTQCAALSFGESTSQADQQKGVDEWSKSQAEAEAQLRGDCASANGSIECPSAILTVLEL